MRTRRGTLVIGIVAQILTWVPARAEEKALFPPVTRQEVWQAVAGELERHGLGREQLPPAGDLDLPVAVPAAEGRVLRVAEVCRDASAGRTRFRLECSEAGQCLPFFAYVPKIEAVAGACRTEARRPREQKRKIVVRTGERVMLVYAANRLRVTATVTCLERGGEGEIVRVRNQDGRIFRARVTAPGWLEAWPQ